MSVLIESNKLSGVAQGSMAFELETITGSAPLKAFSCMASHISMPKHAKRRLRREDIESSSKRLQP